MFAADSSFRGTLPLFTCFRFPKLSRNVLNDPLGREADERDAMTALALPPWFRVLGDPAICELPFLHIVLHRPIHPKIQA